MMKFLSFSRVFLSRELDCKQAMAVFVRPAGGTEVYSEGDGAAASDWASRLVLGRRVCNHRS